MWINQPTIQFNRFDHVIISLVQFVSFYLSTRLHSPIKYIRRILLFINMSLSTIYEQLKFNCFAMGFDRFFPDDEWQLSAPLARNTESEECKRINRLQLSNHVRHATHSYARRRRRREKNYLSQSSRYPASASIRISHITATNKPVSADANEQKEKENEEFSANVIYMHHIHSWCNTHPDVVNVLKSMLLSRLVSLAHTLARSHTIQINADMCTMPWNSLCDFWCAHCAWLHLKFNILNWWKST